MNISALANDGSLLYQPGQPEKIKSWLTERNGKTVYVTFSERRPPRSLEQNSYYRGVVVKYISDFTGDDPESTHDDLKKMFCPRFFDEEGNELARSTTRLSTKEFKEYIDRITAWAATEYAIPIPSPDDA